MMLLFTLSRKIFILYYLSFEVLAYCAFKSVTASNFFRLILSFSTTCVVRTLTASVLTSTKFSAGGGKKKIKLRTFICTYVFKAGSLLAGGHIYDSSNRRRKATVDKLVIITQTSHTHIHSHTHKSGTRKKSAHVIPWQLGWGGSS